MGEKKMTINPIISVVMPVYNAEKYLDESIESILKQTYQNFEFIIINDGSIDKSLEIIKKYQNQDERIVLISRENKGLVASLNEGIAKAKGKYIARMDADDVSLSERLETQLKYMITNNLDICGGNYLIIDQNSKTISTSEVPESFSEILLTMVSNVPFAHPSVMIKKFFLDDKKLKYGINGYKNAEDLDLWINMYNQNARFGNVKKRIIKYRVVPTSMSRTNHKKIKIESNNSFNQLMKERKNEFEELFNHIERKNLTNTMQLNLVRANWRYFFLNKNYKFLFLNFKKIRFYNVLKGTLSFFKYKVL